MTRLTRLFQNPEQILYMLPAILLGLTLHEWGHAFAAYKLGDPTARNMGRLSLNPLDHVDPLGLVSLLLLGFGWAKPVPVNPRNFKNTRRDELIVSLAGIVMNILEVLVFSVLFTFLLSRKQELFNNEAFYNIFLDIILINTSLAVFNLIPVPPLDGSHILECLLGGRLTFRVRSFLYRYGQFILIALLYLGILDYPLSAAQNLVIRFLNYLLRLFR